MSVYDQNDLEALLGTPEGRAHIRALAGRELTKAEIAVLDRLAFHRNEDTGACFPSIERMAKRTGHSESVIKRARKSLYELGLIGWSIHGAGHGGGRLECRYTLSLPTVPSEPVHGDPLDIQDHDPNGSEGVSNGSAATSNGSLEPAQGVTVTYKPEEEPEVDESEEENTEGDLTEIPEHSELVADLDRVWRAAAEWEQVTPETIEAIQVALDSDTFSEDELREIIEYARRTNSADTLDLFAPDLGEAMLVQARRSADREAVAA